MLFIDINLHIFYSSVLIRYIIKYLLVKWPIYGDYTHSNVTFLLIHEQVVAYIHKTT